LIHKPQLRRPSSSHPRERFVFHHTDGRFPPSLWESETSLTAAGWRAPARLCYHLPHPPGSPDRVPGRGVGAARALRSPAGFGRSVMLLRVAAW
jgi:hypothetical protein